MSIGENVKKKRLALGLSQAELAKKINITQSMLCQIERGTKTPALPLGKELADALGCALEELLV